MRASVLHVAIRFSQSKVQQANGCSQLASCVHTHHRLVSRASSSYSNERERVWGIVHIRRFPIKEFPKTNQIAERMNIHCKNVINVLLLLNKNSWLVAIKYLP